MRVFWYGTVVFSMNIHLQALNDFAYIIDPQAVYITSVIGGGEFGDVCMGHLKRSFVGTGTYDSGRHSEKEVRQEESERERKREGERERRVRHSIIPHSRSRRWPSRR